MTMEGKEGISEGQNKVILSSNDHTPLDLETKGTAPLKSQKLHIMLEQQIVSEDRGEPEQQRPPHPQQHKQQEQKEQHDEKDQQEQEQQRLQQSEKLPQQPQQQDTKAEQHQASQQMQLQNLLENRIDQQEEGHADGGPHPQPLSPLQAQPQPQPQPQPLSQPPPPPPPQPLPKSLSSAEKYQMNGDPINNRALRDYNWNWQETHAPNPNPNIDYYVNYARQTLRLPPLLVNVPQANEELVNEDDVSDVMSELGSENNMKEDGNAKSSQEFVTADSSDSEASVVGDGSKSFHHDGDNCSDANNNQETEHDYTKQAAEDSKYQTYSVLVDPMRNDQAVEILLFSMARPHMRSFHFAWISFFIAFFTWFAMTPLLGEIGRSLDLTKKEIWTSSVLAVAGSAITRILIGPINDKYGARWAMTGTLITCAIPTILAGAVCYDQTSLYIIRSLIGVAGSAFVTCQFWTSSLFTREVAGTANALAAGWGNLGGGVAQIFMGTFLFPIFKIIYGGTGFELSDAYHENESEIADTAADRAWRTVLVFPGVLCLIMVYAIIRHSDDTPKGNIVKRRKQKKIPDVSFLKAFFGGARNLNTWILFIQYGCCFGVEITITNAAALYFQDEFGQNTETAAAIASVFGLMNLFARGIGGFGSDMLNAMWGMRGRLWFQVITLVCEGALVILFTTSDTLVGAIFVMMFFSFFVQAAEGSTFGIVPYVDLSCTGSISGIVGAGGNVVGVGFSLFFREFTYHDAFLWMGLTVMLSSLLTVFIQINGHRRLFCGRDGTQVFKRRRLHNEQLKQASTAANDEVSGRFDCAEAELEVDCVKNGITMCSSKTSPA